MTRVGRIDLWAPPVALMALIFLLSAQPDLSSGLGAWDTLLRKIVHAGEYALLFLLWWRAFREVRPGTRALMAACRVTVGYSATDEWHQTFVSGRHGTPLDVL